MLKSVNFSNYRAYKHTGEIKLTKLNVFIGANNAGKSSFLSAIELFFRSKSRGGQMSPLRTESMPTFATFDSVLRKHWSPAESRAKEFTLGYTFGDKDSESSLTVDFGLNEDDSSPIATTITYELPDVTIKLKRTAGAQLDPYNLTIKGAPAGKVDVFFSGFVPYPTRMLEKRTGSGAGNLPTYFMKTNYFREISRLEVVNPSRPVPRSLYVLDDPHLGPDDKDLLSHLVSIFGAGNDDQRDVRNRIVKNLEVLGLAKAFSVESISKKAATRIVAIKVAPSNKRQKVTIADAGFGLSQALPLIAKDARLSTGALISYQPEVHLHPFAQSRLADIFAASISRGNQVFIETHSPDFVLRLQRLIADGTISADDASVFCFENKGGASTIRPIDFTQTGSPSIKWPEGFLDTSLVLARELAISRNRG